VAERHLSRPAFLTFTSAHDHALATKIATFGALSFACTVTASAPSSW
jgi:hypothetical protein